MQNWFDFRSDTVTKPTPAMLTAMFEAKVGDDVFGEDPSILALQEKAAQLFQMEAALYCPSGTMTNQIAINVHTQPGDEVICEGMAHVYQYEGGGIAKNSSAQVRAVAKANGCLTVADIAHLMNPEDVHKARTSLLCVENTHNRAGGTCYSIADIQALGAWCKENKIAYHLDGARLFNALVATRQHPNDYGKVFDSISICLSKGLGAPVGSLLLGKKSFIDKAKRIRKVFGGGMRQAGYMAAAGLYALENHVDRLAEDHRNAERLATLLCKCSWVADVNSPQTNIVIITTAGEKTAAFWVNQLQQEGILCFAISPSQIRMVTHLDISGDKFEEALQRIPQ